MHICDLPEELFHKIFIASCNHPKFLSLRLVSRVWKLFVENNLQFKLEFCSQSKEIRLIRINHCLEKSTPVNASFLYLKNCQLLNCIKEVSLEFDPGFKQDTVEIRRFASILNHRTDLSIICNIDINTPEPTSFLVQGANLAEQFPNFRLISFRLYSFPPYPEYTKYFVRYYLTNSDYLQKLKLGSIDMLEAVLKPTVETGQSWRFLKDLDIYISQPQGISGGVRRPDIPFSSDPIKTFSGSLIAEKMPNLSKLCIAAYECVIDLNGLANFERLKSFELWFGVGRLTQAQCDLVFEASNFRQTVKSVKNLNLRLFSFQPKIKRFDFIFEQYPFLRRLQITLQGGFDQNFLISTIKKGNLYNLESLNISRQMALTTDLIDNQLPNIFCDDSVGMFCPKLTKLSLELFKGTSLRILTNCSELIQQLTINSIEVVDRVELESVITLLDSNQRNQNIILNVVGSTTFGVQLLRKYSKKFRLENRNHPGGTCLVKCRNNRLLQSLVWQTKNIKKGRQLCVEFRDICARGKK
jgi:hypothetical protein